jgi:hypothetical protein
MAATDPYATVAEFKAFVGVDDDRDDAAILAALKAASRQIDGWTGDFFGQTAEEARYFPVRYVRPWGTYGLVELDSLVSVAEVAFDDGTGTWPDAWDAADYVLLPYGANARSLPYREVRPTSASLNFPYWVSVYAPASHYPAARVTGVWGWPAVPDPIKQAAIVQANRLWKRDKAPFGTTGSPQVGEVRVLTKCDPDVLALIANYARLAV